MLRRVGARTQPCFNPFETGDAKSMHRQKQPSTRVRLTPMSAESWLHRTKLSRRAEADSQHTLHLCHSGSKNAETKRM